jgi:hypothetical protein
MPVTINKKKWIRILIITFIIIFYFVIRNLDNPNNRLILESSCIPPCWHNIVPGITSEKDLAEYIQNLDFLDKESINEIDSKYYIFDKRIIVTTKPRINILYPDKLNITFYLSNGTVRDIKFCNNMNIKLRDLFNKIDAPTHISSEFCCGDVVGTAAEVINTKIGYSAYIDKQFKKSDAITPQERIGCLEFFDPAEFQKLKEQKYFNGKFYPWSGYADDLEEKYPYYDK